MIMRKQKKTSASIIIAEVLFLSTQGAKGNCQ